MSFIRPEVRAAAWRWREALTGVAIALFGLWWVSKTAALMTWIGLGVVLLGLAMVLTGIQRGRFRSPGDGPGLVRVTEAQIAYMGPLTGGMMALDLIDAIALDPTGKPLHWVLVARDGTRLHIPVTAAGSEALLDAFAQLPDFRTETVLDGLSRPGRVPRTLWRRAPPADRGRLSRVH